METLVAAEVRPFGRVRRIGHREVFFDCAEPTPEVAELRCADDVLLVAAELTGVGRRRAALRLLAEAAENVPGRRMLALRRRFGGPAHSAHVDVTASFVGRRNYNRYDLEDAVGVPLSAALGVPYRSRRNGAAPPAGGCSWRVTVVDDRAVLALRIRDRPAHRREYRQIHRPGSLHPPLASALVRLAEPFDGARLLDPCCGTGTIPVEAALSGHSLSVIGCDLDPGAVAAAAVNGAGTAARWAVADAGRLPVASGSVDLVVSNPPWDRQVRPAGVLAREPARFWRELRRVLRPGGRAVLLLPEPDLRGAESAGLAVLDRRPVSLFGSHPEVVRLRA